MDLSEFSTAPKRILIHDPADGAALGAMTGERLGECNFLDLPAAERFAEEYRGLRAALAEAAEVVTLADLLGDDPGFRAEADSNPNLMFVRDSSITLPWAPDLYIPARLNLPSRAKESAIAGAALERLGLKPRIPFRRRRICRRRRRASGDGRRASGSCSSALACARPRRPRSASRSS